MIIQHDFRRHRTTILACTIILCFGLLLAAPPEVLAITAEFSEDFTDFLNVEEFATNASFGMWPYGSVRMAPLTARYLETEAIGSSYQWGRFIDGSTLYIAGDTYGLDVVDISTPASPSFVTHISVTASSVSVAGNWMYVSDRYSGFHIYNITDIMSPTQVDMDGSIDAWDAFVEGNYAYVATSNNGITILNITNPYAIQSVANYTTIDSLPFNRITKVGNYLYCLEAATPTFDYGLRIVNVTDIENPDIAGRCAFYGGGYDLSVSGDYAFVNTGDMHVISLANISEPTELNSATMLCGGTGNFQVAGDYAFGISSGAGLQVMSIGNPLNLQNTIINPDISGAWLCVIGEYIYVANFADELEVYELDVAYSATVQSTPVYTPTHSEYSVARATLQVNDSTTAETSIDYYLSADNGTHWEAVVLGVTHSFTNIGRYLKWKAVLQTTVEAYTPVLYELDITIKALLDAPQLNALAFPDQYNIPTISWQALDYGEGYVVQIDTVSTFDSPSLISDEVYYVYSYTVPSALANGTYYYRVAGIDIADDTGFFSDYQTMVIGTTTTTITTTTTTTPPPLDPMMLIIVGVVGVIAIVAIVVVMQRRK